MNQLFLLKMVLDLLDEKPSKEQIHCAKKILKNMIGEEQNPVPQPVLKSSNVFPRPGQGIPFYDPQLDEEAIQAKNELLK